MLEHFETILEILANFSMMCFELVGIIVLIVAGVRGVIDYINHNPQMRLILAEGMATSLEFKLGSEIIRTTLVRQLSELYFIGALIIIRASLTLLIHWEIKQEEKKESKSIQIEELETEVASLKTKEKNNEDTDGRGRDGASGKKDPTE